MLTAQNERQQRNEAALIENLSHASSCAVRFAVLSCVDSEIVAIDDVNGVIYSSTRKNKLKNLSQNRLLFYHPMPQLTSDDVQIILAYNMNGDTPEHQNFTN